MLLQKEKEKKKSIHRNINLIGFCQSILCQYFAEIYPISSAIQRTSCCFFFTFSAVVPSPFFLLPIFSSVYIETYREQKKIDYGKLSDENNLSISEIMAKGFEIQLSPTIFNS